MITAYPLTWPIGYPRSKFPSAPRFSKKSLSVVTSLLKEEVRKIGGSGLIISSNIPLRNDGYPRSDYERRTIDDKGVAVYFQLKGKQVVLACDSWNTVEYNMYAVCLSIEAMRGLERWGVSDILERSFSGFQALPPGQTKEELEWWKILGLPYEMSDMEEIQKAYKARVKITHPDSPTGSHDAFLLTQRAYKNGIAHATTNFKNG